MEDTTASTKACSRCGEIKPRSEFQRRAASVDGLQPRCKSCAAEYKQAHYLANRERILQAERAYRARLPRNPKAKLTEEQRAESRRAKNLRFKARHAARIAAEKRLYRQAHPEKSAAQWQAWATANRERASASGRRWRAAKAAATSEPYTRAEVWAKSDGVCGICASPIPSVGEGWHIDHILPLSLGGDDTLANLQAAHARCNLSKGNRIA